MQATGNILPNSQFLSNIAAYVAERKKNGKATVGGGAPSYITGLTVGRKTLLAINCIETESQKKCCQLEEAAMKCIAMRLSFISLRPKANQQICDTHTHTG